MEKNATPVRVCLITIDSGHPAEPKRECEQICETILAREGHVLPRHIVLDQSESRFKEILNDLSGQDICDAILIVGGTGVRPGNVHDALMSAFETTLDGIGESVRRALREKIGPTAILVRAKAGIIGDCPVFILPLSPEAIRIALDDVILPALGGAIALARES